MNEFYNKHYVIIDAQNRITSGWSNGPHPEIDPTEGLCINKQGGYQFRLFPGGEENPPLYTMDGIPLYKYVDGEVVPRTEDEIAADRAAIPDPEPTLEELNESKLDFLMAINGMVNPPRPGSRSLYTVDTTPTIVEYINKYYPKLWGNLHLMKLVEVGLITGEDYERLVNF